MSVWLDGRFVAPGSVPQRQGIAPFETIGTSRGTLPLWPHHLDRLTATAARLGIDWTPPQLLWPAAHELVRGTDDTDPVLRLTLLPHAAGLATLLETRARSPVRIVQLLPTVVQRPADAPPGDLKAEPRRFYDLVRAQAQDGGADDGLVVAPCGAVLEAALGNLWLRLDGIWVTPELDGRVLPGIARALLLAAARSAGLPVAERRCELGDLHRAAAIAHSNAVHGPRPACLVGQPAAAALVAAELGALWSAHRPVS